LIYWLSKSFSISRFLIFSRFPCSVLSINNAVLGGRPPHKLLMLRRIFFLCSCLFTPIFCVIDKKKTFTWLYKLLLVHTIADTRGGGGGIWITIILRQLIFCSVFLLVCTSCKAPCRKLQNGFNSLSLDVVTEPNWAKDIQTVEKNIAWTTQFFLLTTFFFQNAVNGVLNVQTTWNVRFGITNLSMKMKNP
jgi:hypothetical protein